MGRGYLWENKCECGHSEARHKPSFNERNDVDGRWQCGCKNCSCSRFVQNTSEVEE